MASLLTGSRKQLHDRIVNDAARRSAEDTDLRIRRIGAPGLAVPEFADGRGRVPHTHFHHRRHPGQHEDHNDAA